jgi:hypothetical protein
MGTGKGKITWKGGSSYEGSWVNYKIHGAGTLIDKHGVKSTCNWVRGLRQGNGVIEDAQRDRLLEGFFIGDRIIGDASVKRLSTGKLIYKGIVVNEKEDGYGV